MATVLVSGAGVAGPVVAYWLRRCGFRPTIVERRPALGLGDGGHAVDLFGAAVEVIERMGLLDAVHAARTRTVALSLIRPGRRPVDVDMSALVTGVSSRHVEILRGDLVNVLHGATRDDVEYMFGDAVTGLTDSEGGVEVTFAHGPPRRFDLVVGADGLHSGIRRLVFGNVPEHFLGGYLGVFTVPYEIRPRGRMLGYSAVDRTVGVYEVGGDGRARALFMFRSADELDYDHRDSARQRQLLRTAFAGLGWDVPRLLEALDTADDFYFDAISQIRMPSWSRGRVTLVGDAGYCPGPAVENASPGVGDPARAPAAQLAAPAAAARAHLLRGWARQDARQRRPDRHAADPVGALSARPFSGHAPRPPPPRRSRPSAPPAGLAAAGSAPPARPAAGRQRAWPPSCPLHCPS
jgi:2-polyprenyl-6-methoxyphenol hydroxylase-like FAD-dependent oxidoreductase